jgi:histidine triad (HIT) family protein
VSAQADCVFCKIAAGDIPSMKIVEDGQSLAFLDINPLAEGHVLLIPKDHFETLDEMSPDVVAAVTAHLPRLVAAVTSVAGAEGCNVLQNNGQASGQVVPHVHFHVIPRRSGDALGYRWPAGSYEAGRAEQVHAALKQALGA